LNRFVQETVRQERLRVTDRGQHPAMVRLREHQGSLPLGNPVRAAICPLRPLALTRESLAGTWRQRAVGLAMPALGAVSWCRRRSRASRMIAASSLSVRSLQRLDPRFDALWSQAAAEFDVVVVRDRSHLEWRYIDRRGGASTILAAEDRGELVGWAVLKMQGARAYLADLLVVPGVEAAACALAVEARARAERAGAVQLSCWLPRRHPYRAALRRAGLLGWGRPVPLAYRFESEGGVDDGRLRRPDQRLHLTLGDFDFV
jgi:hypothetical protein